MLTLSFKQTNAEIMIRAAATLLFNCLKRSGVPQVALSELAEHPQYGFTASALVEEVGPKFVRITDLQAGRIDWDMVPYCGCPEPQNYLLKPNDLLFARTGVTTGKTYLVAETPDAVFASYLIRTRAKTGVKAGYLYSFFQSEDYWSQIIGEKEGSAQANVNGQKLMSLTLPACSPELQESISRFLEAVRARQNGSKVPLPELPAPLAEQWRIVARLEKLAAKINEARGLRQKAAEEAQALGHFSLDSMMGRGVAARSLSDLCIQITDGEHATPPRVDEREVPLATAKNVRDGYLDMRFTDFVTRVTAESCWKRCKPTDGDVLMVCVGATTGRVCRLVSPPDMVIVRSVALLRPNGGILDSRFLEYALESHETQAQIWNSVKQAAQPCLYLNRIATLTIPVPSLSEQRRIVVELDALQSQVDALKRLQSETAAELDALLPSILDRAFKGEL